jgi:glycerol-1-phosphate dehydrogenase [NAD(P)+]
MVCACGKTHENVTEKIVIEKNAAPLLFDYVRQNFGSGAKGGIICDKNTYTAAKNIMGLGEPVILNIKSFHADEYIVEDCE